MLYVLVLVICNLEGSQITACAAPYAFRRGGPSQALILCIPIIPRLSTLELLCK
jgi:hypothetical protein